jgi:hypothetical protein
LAAAEEGVVDFASSATATLKDSRSAIREIAEAKRLDVIRWFPLVVGVPGPGRGEDSKAGRAGGLEAC